MSKELTALEALNIIYDKYVTDDEFLEDDKLFSIIEKALKEVSGEDKAFLRHVKTGKLHPLTTKNYQNLLEKQRALEIIKQKEVCVYLLTGCDNIKQYNNSMDLFEIPKKDRHKYHLTKEQFDLLKEVLK